MRPQAESLEREPRAKAVSPKPKAQRPEPSAVGVLHYAPISPASISELEQRLASQHYVADRGLAVSLYLALTLRRPLFLEGEAGVGKTALAPAVAATFHPGASRRAAPAAIRAAGPWRRASTAVASAPMVGRPSNTTNNRRLICG